MLTYEHTSKKPHCPDLKCQDRGVFFELKVNLGRCKTLDPDDAEIKTWQQHYDSAWHLSGAVNSVEEEKEENCVKDPEEHQDHSPHSRTHRQIFGIEASILILYPYRC
jgi:hypothetical protein